ncbi:MAG: FIST C-terminal domain-containing protein [Myxococcota bacterium]|nr:FIST C-terminal domain-containing protein [Myxococcota bacterium]
MLQTAAIFTNDPDPAGAGAELARLAMQALGGERPDAMIVFAASNLATAEMLAAIHQGAAPAALIGCSSAGEFTQTQFGTQSACALVLRSDEMSFASSIGSNMAADPGLAARELVRRFRGATSGLPHRCALVMTDTLAGHAHTLVDTLTELTAGEYEFVGGGAADDERLAGTTVFCDHEIASDAVVALEILSKRPVAVGVAHGWSAASPPLRVTESEGSCVRTLNGFPAVEALAAHAAETGQRFDRAEPIPFFLHNVLGIETANGLRIRVPLALGPDGSILCAAEIPRGSIIRVMRASAASAREAAMSAVRVAASRLGGAPMSAALFFDCIATRLRLGAGFGLEVEGLREAVGDAQLVGCNTYGQLARAEGQFDGFHNCTAVVLAIA